MTRQELLDKLAAAEYKNINYTTAQVITAISTASTAEKDSLAGALNALDKDLVGTILIQLFTTKRQTDAVAAVNAKIANDKIDIDDAAAALNGGI